MKKDNFKVANKNFKSRLIVGTGKYRNMIDLFTTNQKYQKSLFFDFFVLSREDCFVSAIFGVWSTSFDDPASSIFLPSCALLMDSSDDCISEFSNLLLLDNTPIV